MLLLSPLVLALQHHDPQVACGNNAPETQQKRATNSPVIMKLAPPTAKGLPAPPPILIANNNRDTSSSLHQGVTHSQPTKAASLSLSPVEKFLLENLLFAAMAAAVAVAAVTGAAMMQN